MSEKKKGKMSRSEAGKLGAKKSLDIIEAKKNERIEKYNLNPTICKECGKALSYGKRHNKFCDRKCAVAYNNKINPKRGRTKFLKKCLGCGKKTYNPKYCSSKCCNEHRKSLTEQKIKKGEYKVVTTTSSIIKNFLLKERGARCEECGLSEWQGKPIPLNVHHIDGDASNNLPSNLQLLCLNCHGLTENYGNKNKNSSRKYRYNK